MNRTPPGGPPPVPLPSTFWGLRGGKETTSHVWGGTDAGALPSSPRLDSFRNLGQSVPQRGPRSSGRGISLLPQVVGVLLCSVSVPKAVQVGCLVLFVGGVAAALGGELRGRPRLADGAPGASDAEHAALRRVVEESKMQARAGMRAHLQEFLGGHPQARYEEWIADFHPDNVVPPGRDSRGLPSIDRRHYHERSDHRMIWNEHVGDQRRHVSQFSLWLAEEAERAAARAELGWAWPADDEPAPEAEMEALDDVDSTKQLILAGGLPVSVFNQWAQLERMRLVLDAGARRLCIRGSEDRAHQDDGESEESWDVGKMRSRTKGNPALGPDVSAVARLCAGLPVSLQR
ncbi:unnamed protein product [Prorocentrum cordatum]|uniref:Uncharacterized protein n=1 Tax=Prorocentrum cordatum TaxID=2364126 RepID=A0ABN9TV16_9DINO|nr:unnamed protein product [Polarella glacialis]